MTAILYKLNATSICIFVLSFGNFDLLMTF